MSLLPLPSAAHAPDSYRFRSSLGQHLLVVPHSQIYDLPEQETDVDTDADASIDHALSQMLARTLHNEASLDALSLPTVQSLSLNVSSSCNLGCSYCYASQGNFEGKQSKGMNWEQARSSIDRLLAEADPQAPLTLGFIGGEPFVNRALIHQCVHYSAALARQQHLDLRYSVTTNGTLLRPEDHELLRQHRFAVTVSIDGGSVVQNRQRPMLNGKRDSFAAVLEHCQPLLDTPGMCKLAARATANSLSLDLDQQFDAIAALGFQDVGFSPLRSGSALALQEHDWSTYEQAMVSLASRELQRALQGEQIRMSNFATALKQLHAGASSPYPCGAGGGYFSVASDGDWYACHRAIGNHDYKLGDRHALDAPRRLQFLQERHVHAQTDCHSCWARYLCSGGCHQEKASRTQASCDYIRQWLTFCLQSYCELSQARPDYFAHCLPSPRASVPA